jgi:Slime mold cyclic AMP receptor
MQHHPSQRFKSAATYIPGSRRFFNQTTASSSGKDIPAASTRKSLSRSNKNHFRSRKIAMQGICFVAAFYLTWFFATVNRINELAGGQPSFFLAVMHAILSPSQGFWFCLVYIRPRYLKYYEDNPGASLLDGIRSIMYGSYSKYSKSTRVETTNSVSVHARMKLGELAEESKEEVEDFTDNGETIQGSKVVNNEFTVSFEVLGKIEEAERPSREVSADQETIQADEASSDPKLLPTNDDDDEASIGSETLL